MAIIVRSVTAMATTILKRSVCLSACFGVFAGGWRRYVNPAPNQIGVHSTAISTGAETPDTQAYTTFAARRLSAIGVPDKIIAKIVLTPPEQMYFLTLDDLWSMGVHVTGLQRPPGLGPAPVPLKDPNPLYVARVVQTIGFADGSIIPSGTLVVIWDQCSYPEARTPMCFVSYASGDVVKGGTVYFSYLRLIKQGW